MSRNAASGRGESTGEPDDPGVQLMGIVVEVRRGNTVAIYNAWLHENKNKDVVEWEGQDSYDVILKPCDWVAMIWRRERVTKVTLHKGDPPMPARVCRSTRAVLVETDLSLRDADGGKHEKQLWSEEFHSVGLSTCAYTKDMKVGGGTKKMWIAWMAQKSERDRHLQRTGYDVVWMLAFDQGEQMFANGRGEYPNVAGDSGVASLSTPIQSDSSTETTSVESHSDRVRLRGSYPGKALNRVGIITGQQPGTPTYYVWSPGAPPMMEGRLIARKVNGEEQIRVCDWIHFRVRKSDEDVVFKNRDQKDRFEVIEWMQVDRYFPTQLSKNKQTIDIAVDKMVMTSENTKIENGDVFYEDKDFGWIADRNSLFLKEFPIEEGHFIEFEAVLRRVKPRSMSDSPWMILQRKAVFKGVMKKKNERPPESKECRNDAEDEGRSVDDCYYSNDGRNNSNDRRSEWDGREETRGRNEHYLLHPPRYEKKVVGDVIESTAFVEGLGASEAYVWLTDAAAPGIVNGGAKYLHMGDVVYAKFRLQRNGKWGSMDPAKADELPRDLSIDVRRGKVHVKTMVIYDKIKDEYRNPWFDKIYDEESRMPPNPVDKEIYEVEATKIRSGFKITKLLNN